MNYSANFRVLSVQSHVVSGYVGNKSACFPLQVLGLEVDIINSVQLSNHTGYGHIKGQCLDSNELEVLFEGLKLNDLVNYTHILTGYVGSVTFLNKLVDVVAEIKERNPNVCYVCDPVMGDNNKMYVPAELLPVYRDILIPLADLVTPNQYELELLTDMKIKSKEDAVKAMDILHDKGVKTVILSSVELESSEKLQLFGSSIKGSSKSVICMDIPKLQASFTGTGDLFSALLLAWMAKTEDIQISCENTVNSLQSVLRRTLEYAEACKDPVFPFDFELKLIQSKKDIENPCRTLKCHIL